MWVSSSRRTVALMSCLSESASYVKFAATAAPPLRSSCVSLPSKAGKTTMPRRTFDSTDGAKVLMKK
jgi:hypothetical protein